MCTSPILIRPPLSDNSFFKPTYSVLSVPCGKCCECLKDRQNSWKIRLVNECSQWQHLYFFTLTYSEASVPRNEFGRSTASVSDIQNWLKRFRTNFFRKYNRILDFKYFICAEYAPEGTYISRKGKVRKSTCRPHYHGLIFTNEPFEIFRPLFCEWESLNGFVQVDEVAVTTRDIRGERSKVANYVSKYCCKGEFASRKDEIARGEISKAFTLCSKGIGLSYVLRYKSFHLDGFSNDPYSVPTSRQFNNIISRRFVMDGEYRYKMPRYYIDKIYRRLSTRKVKFYNSSTGKIEFKDVKSYNSKSVLCYKIQNFYNERILERMFNEIDPATFEVSQSLGFVSPAHQSLSIRDSRLRSKLKTFYQTNASKNASLAVD